MKNKHLFIIATVCALCTFGAQDARAQKMYMDGEMLILDCGSDSGFPQNIVEKQTGQKATIQNDINLIHGSQNKTVYQKLEIETSNNSKVTWTAAYNACAGKNKDGVTVWRLPTQREMHLISIFGTSIKELTKNELAICWALTEQPNEGGWYVRPDGFSAAASKAVSVTEDNRDIYYRCVREIPVTETAPATQVSKKTK
jgi:hypothetical protein